MIFSPLFTLAFIKVLRRPFMQVSTVCQLFSSLLSLTCAAKKFILGGQYTETVKKPKFIAGYGTGLSNLALHLIYHMHSCMGCSEFDGVDESSVCSKTHVWLVPDLSLYP